MTKSASWGGKGLFHLTVYSRSSRKTGQKPGDTNGCRDQGGMLFTSFSLTACLACFLTQSKATNTVGAQPRMICVLPNRLLIRTMYHIVVYRRSGSNFSVKVCSSKLTSLCPVIIKLGSRSAIIFWHQLVLSPLAFFHSLCHALVDSSSSWELSFCFLIMCTVLSFSFPFLSVLPLLSWTCF